MPRDTRERSVRRDPGLRDNVRDVRLQQNRRFFTPRGNDEAVRNARALQNALGVGINEYANVLEDRNVAGDARALQEAAAGGERNPEDDNKGYNEAFDRVEAVNDLEAFGSELPELLRQNNWLDLDEESAQAIIDEYYAGQLQGINPESVYGKRVAAGILEQNSTLIEAHRKFKAEEAEQERRILVYNAAKAGYDPETGMDHGQLMADLKELVPGPGGRMTYLEAVFDIAEEMGDPEIVDSIPERFPSGDPTGVTDPNMKDLFDNARAKALSVRQARAAALDESIKTAERNKRAALHAADKQLADAGDGRVLTNIADGTKRGPNGEPARYSEAQATALYDRYFNALGKQSDNSLMVEEYATGNAIGYSQTEIDQAHDAFVDVMMAQKPEDVDEAEWQDRVRTVSLERAVVNGTLPSVYKAQLSVNLSNPEKFKQAAELYEQLQAQEAGFAETQINNAQSRKLDAYGRMLQETGGDENRAIELLKAFEPGRSTSMNKEIGTAVEEVSEMLADTKPGWGDYANNARLKSQVADEVRFYVDSGFEPEVAAKYAFEHMSRRYVRAGDFLYAKDAGWGQDPQATYNWAIANEASHRGVDPDTLTLVPTGDEKLVRFQHEDEVLPSGKPMRIDLIGQDYLRFTNESYLNRLEQYDTANADALKEAEQRAMMKRYPDNPWLESGERARLNAMRTERWNALNPETKQKLIAEQLK